MPLLGKVPPPLLLLLLLLLGSPPRRISELSGLERVNDRSRRRSGPPLLLLLLLLLRQAPEAFDLAYRSWS